VHPLRPLGAASSAPDDLSIRRGGAVVVVGAPVAQLDRVLGYEEGKEWFESGERPKGIRHLGESVWGRGVRSDQGVTKRRQRGSRAECRWYGC